MPFLNDPEDDYEPELDRSPASSSLTRNTECRPCAGSGVRNDLSGVGVFCTNCRGTGRATTPSDRVRFSWGRARPR